MKGSDVMETEDLHDGGAHVNRVALFHQQRHHLVAHALAAPLSAPPAVANKAMESWRPEAGGPVVANCLHGRPAEPLNLAAC